MNDGLSISERLRRFWLPGKGLDHPVNEEERSSTPPDTAIGELSDLAGDWLAGGAVGRPSD